MSCDRRCFDIAHIDYKLDDCASCEGRDDGRKTLDSPKDTEITSEESCLSGLLAEWRGKVHRLPIDEAFEKFTVCKNATGGKFSVECVNGNFSVFGSDKEEVHNEAKHYFRQYYEDGEYDS